MKISKVQYIQVILTILLFSISLLTYEKIVINSPKASIGWKRWWKSNNDFEKNIFGFRGKFLDKSEYINKNIVLLVGDSQVETSHPFKLMPARLLENYLGEKYKVISLGSWGYGNLQHKFAIEEAIKFTKENDLKISNIVLWFSVNDYTDNLSQKGFNGLRSYYSTESKRFLNPSPILKVYLRIYSILSKLKNSIFEIFPSLNVEYAVKNNDEKILSPKEKYIYNYAKKELKDSRFHKAISLDFLRYKEEPELSKRNPLNNIGVKMLSIENSELDMYERKGLKILSDSYLRNYNNFSDYMNKKNSKPPLEISACFTSNFPGFSDSIYPKIANKIFKDIKILSTNIKSSFLIISTEKECWDTRTDLFYKGKKIISSREAGKTFEKTFSDIDVFLPNFEMNYEIFDGFDNHLSTAINDKVMQLLSIYIKNNSKI